MKAKTVVTSLALAGAIAATAGPATITVQADKPGAKVSPTLFGIFFEDINCSADGGIYAEMVRNRSFEDSDQPESWSLVKSGQADAEMAVVKGMPMSAKNERSLKVTVINPGSGRVGVVNNGYWGMSLAKGQTYNLTLNARGDGSFTGPLTATLESSDGAVYGKQTIPEISSDWKSYSVSFTVSETDPTSRLVISTTKPGTFWLDVVSLFPQNTWNNRQNGLRPDLAEMLVGLKPSFVRFPGGCWVEGDTMSLAYRWKQTIGDISDRRTQFNIWNYYATHGLGFHEYLQMCEDLHAEPLFVINCGMSHKEVIPMNKMGEFVQDALDAIEYCNGPADSKWGSVRAKNGHPAPFNLKYMEIGNENGGAPYNERYPLFYDAIKAKYPDMHLISDVWGGVVNSRKPEIVDEHYYDSPRWFMRNADKYDSYSRSGPKVYVGEYAVTSGAGLGNLKAAVGEAAWMTGMERNSDVVVMASYAPLFVNVNHRGWNPDLIAYDSSRAYGIPSYYVQKMFSENRGDVVLPAKVEATKLPPEPFRGAVGVGTWATRVEFKDLKVTRGSQTLFSTDFANGTKGWKVSAGDWKTQDGILQQNSTATDPRAVVGDENWGDYTYSLKARKLSGDEGFLIMFAMRNGVRSWWNIGGWGNTQEGLEVEGASSERKPFKVEANRWYDIRVELNGPHIKCYLDNKLTREATVDTGETPTMFASATRDTASGEIILKVVNGADETAQTEIKLAGINGIAGPVNATMLSSEKGADENTLRQPEKVVPVAKTLRAAGNSILGEFPANSVTVIRARTGSKTGTN